MTLRSVRCVAVAVSLFVAACSPDAGDPVAADEAAATSSSDTITLANYVAHPRIKEIRAEVAAIEAAGYREETKGGCDGHNVKLTDASGVIRKVVSEGGEGDGSGSTTGYFGDNGKLRFLFFTFTGENESGGFTTSQSRVYFDTSGKAFWQVSREASSTDGSDPDIRTAPDTITPADASYVSGDGHAATYEDAAAWFEETGCGEP